MSLLEASPADTTSSDPATELLIEFGQLWTRGLADPGKLWQLFDRCEMYLFRPDCYGVPVFGVSGRFVTPVFSTEVGLAEFMMNSAVLGPASGADGYDWVCLTGEQFFQLPVRARYLAIDPGSEREVTVDLAERTDAPAYAADGRPLLVNLDMSPDGKVHIPFGETTDLGEGDTQ
ncbi:hypothetical protein ATY41_03305 [Leifsonia xyli subsp. xyli]|uniref:Uncharacterized protein n=2 Tax=Leifsonia xyli subsp. xyli TaxID=59736 RepID=Q6ACD9_LEIXX|nr:hypothetical protein [Leifsonia xyli]AAT89954.1 hypothetical protein Lxx22890 [Leifsonia xyli subsp. xyli str. CTCB07]ODA90064.1 hypothetical protein ATY41_03305 [Leifsonia xyli subsp. xyli]